MKNCCALGLWIFLTAFIPVMQQKPIKIFLAGDSTMAIKDKRAFPETGWGMPFVYFWDSSVTVINRARTAEALPRLKKKVCGSRLPMKPAPGTMY